MCLKYLENNSNPSVIIFSVFFLYILSASSISLGMSSSFSSLELDSVTLFMISSVMHGFSIRYFIIGEFFSKKVELSMISNAFAIYGNPDRAENQRYYWGDGFKVITNNRNMMTMIITTADNGIATPTGLHVGSTVSEMYMIYGRPDETNLEINGNGYVYFYDGGPVCFHIKAENDTIKEISASRYIK